MKTKQLVLNAIVAAMYAVVTIFLPSYGALQLRLSEMFAHLPVFNKKYSAGLILGVVVANIWSPFGIYDVIFGAIHTAVSILLLFLLTKKEDSLVKKMIINTIIFAVTSFIIALMIFIFDMEAIVFWPIYGSVAASIAIVMGLGIPVMLLLNRRINLNKQMGK